MDSKLWDGCPGCVTLKSGVVVVEGTGIRPGRIIESIETNGVEYTIDAYGLTIEQIRALKNHYDIHAYVPQTK